MSILLPTGQLVREYDPEYDKWLASTLTKIYKQQAEGFPAGELTKYFEISADRLYNPEYFSHDESFEILDTTLFPTYTYKFTLIAKAPGIFIQNPRLGPRMDTVQVLTDKTKMFKNGILLSEGGKPTEQDKFVSGKLGDFISGLPSALALEPVQLREHQIIRPGDFIDMEMTITPRKTLDKANQLWDEFRIGIEGYFMGDSLSTALISGKQYITPKAKFSDAVNKFIFSHAVPELSKQFEPETASVESMVVSSNSVLKELPVTEPVKIETKVASSSIDLTHPLTKYLRYSLNAI